MKKNKCIDVYTFTHLFNETNYKKCLICNAKICESIHNLAKFYTFRFSIFKSLDITAF